MDSAEIEKFLRDAEASGLIRQATDQDICEWVARHVDEIAADKPLAYVAAGDVRVTDHSISRFRRRMRERGFCSISTSRNRSYLQFGTIHIYDRKAVEAVLSRFEETLSKLRWPVDARKVVQRLATRFCFEGHEAIPIIRALFGNDRSATR